MLINVIRAQLEKVVVRLGDCRAQAPHRIIVSHCAQPEVARVVRQGQRDAFDLITIRYRDRDRERLIYMN